MLFIIYKCLRIRYYVRYLKDFLTFGSFTYSLRGTDTYSYYLFTYQRVVMRVTYSLRGTDSLYTYGLNSFR